MVSLCNMSIGLIKPSRNIQKCMLAFHNKNTTLRGKIISNISKFYENMFVNVQSFWFLMYRWKYSWHYMLDFLLFYYKLWWWNFPIFMLALLGIFFKRLLLIIKDNQTTFYVRSYCFHSGLIARQLNKFIIPKTGFQKGLFESGVNSFDLCVKFFE